MKNSQEYPEPNRRYVVLRDELLFTATPCFGMHAPWWVTKTMFSFPENENAPTPMREDDEWWSLEEFLQKMPK